MAIAIDALVLRLKAADTAYYNGVTLMSDAAYDLLRDQLRKLDPQNPYLKSVGAPVQSGWQKVVHAQAMQSLNKANLIDEMYSWAMGLKTQNTRYIITEKLDGISISLFYWEGKLIQAVTRGDGTIGEDITTNVVRMKGVPQTIDGFTGYIRGEVVCLKSDHAKHFAGQSNPRNTASGTAKRQSNPEACQYLTVLAYQVSPALVSKRDTLEFLKDAGFAVPNFHIAGTIQAVDSVYQEYIDCARGQLDYDIDGLVVELDDTGLFESKGYLNGNPRAAVAYKFPAEEQPTILRDLQWQVGKSGRITPVAVFDTVSLAGANVSRASLHNIAYIQRLVQAASGVGLYLCAGDQILVARKNDVIPGVEELLAQAEGNITEFFPPENCPCCGSPTEMSGEYLLCVDDTCPANIQGAIVRWLEKVGILHFGPTLVEALLDAGLVQDIADLYTVDVKKAAQISFNGRTVGGTADLAFNNLHAKKELDLHVFLGSLGLNSLIGRSMIKTFVDAGYDTLLKLQNVRASELAQIPGVGMTKADAFVKGMQSKETLITRLLNAGVTIKQKATGNMSGLSMCQTGFRDPAMVSAFEAAGGTVKSSVGKGLTYLVCTNKSGSSTKLDKARQLGTEVKEIAEMWALLN